MNESRSAKLVVVFAVAIVAFCLGSLVAVSTGGIFGLNLLDFANGSSDDNSSNPFSLEMINESYDSLSFSNSYLSCNNEKINTGSNSSSNDNSSNSGNNNRNNGNGDNNEDVFGSDKYPIRL